MFQQGGLKVRSGLAVIGMKRMRTVEPVSCRWMERFHALNSGIRVASPFWNQAGVCPFATVGSTNGGYGNARKLPESMKTGSDSIVRAAVGGVRRESGIVRRPGYGGGNRERAGIGRPDHCLAVQREG